jgi:hypothetical protein
MFSQPQKCMRIKYSEHTLNSAKNEMYNKKKFSNENTSKIVISQMNVCLFFLSVFG